MIKDLVVAVAVGGERDVATDYALSVAVTFDAHVSGVAFAYEPAIPGTVLNGAVVDLVDATRRESRNAAKAAAARFDKAGQNAGVSIDSRVIDANLEGAGDVFGRIARRFDLSVVAQSEPDRRPAQDLIIEGALFQSGRPVIVVPYIHKSGLGLERALVC